MRFLASVQVALDFGFLGPNGAENPLRYFLVIVRGIFLKGVGPATLWPQMAALLVMGLARLWLASRRFQKTLA